MTLEQYRPPETAVYSPQDIAVQRLAEWAQSAQAAMVIAEELVRTSFVPDSFKGKPGEAAAAILAGLEVGLQPMAALRSFDVIQGQAAARAVTLRAIVQAHGHDMILEESTATRCKMRGKRRGANEWQSVTWTTDRAKGLNLLGKDNWRKQPQAMLVARATSELARLIAADAILGIGYSFEELADGAGAGVDIPSSSTPPAAPETGESTTADADPGKPGTRRMSRRTTKAANEPPEQAGIEDAEVVDDTDDQPASITDKQITKLMATYGDVGITNGVETKRVSAALLGVDKVASHKNLTKADASRLIDLVQSVADGRAEFELNDAAEIIGIRDVEPAPEQPELNEGDNP